MGINAIIEFQNIPSNLFKQMNITFLSVNLHRINIIKVIFLIFSLPLNYRSVAVQTSERKGMHLL